MGGLVSGLLPKGGSPREILWRNVPRWKIAVVLALSAIGGLFEASLLILIVRVATQTTNHSAQRAGSGLLTMMIGDLTIMKGVVLGAVFALLAVVLQVASTVMMARAASEKLNHERAALVTAFYASSVTSQSKTSAGAIQELAARGANQVAEGALLTGRSASAWTNLFMLVLVAFLSSPWTAMAMVVVACVIGAAFAPLNRAVVKHSRGWEAKTREYAGFLAIYTRMFIETRVFGVTRQVEQIALGGAREAADSWRRGRSLRLGTPIVFRDVVLLLGFLCIGVVTLVAPAQAGDIAITALLLVRGLAYLQQVLSNRQSVQAMAVFGEQIDKTLRELQPDHAIWGDTPLQEIWSVRVDDISHTYDGDEPTFTHVSFEVRKGEFAAILGPSGGGKTTLLKVLMRTMEPASGKLMINDRPVSSYRRDDWYASVAYLSQEVRLVPGTIADNIRFYREASEGQVRAAAHAAALDLGAFARGLETPVELEGLNLSGGQRQRIGLARCLLLHPQMLVLDEPTSALDADTEESIMKTISDLRSEMIIIMVTHRPSTMAFTDSRYRMDTGRLVLTN